VGVIPESCNHPERSAGRLVWFHPGEAAGGSEGAVSQESPRQVIAQAWAQARYDLKLSEQEFWLLTPRQFHLLWDRHKEELLHRELIQAITTAAVINYSLCRPEEPVSHLKFMPNFTATEQKAEAPVVEVSRDELDDYRSQRAHVSALLQQYNATGKGDPYLVRIGLVADGSS